MLDREELTGKILGAAIAVHKALGPGFIEAVYENALCVELRHQGLAFQRQYSVPILYRDTEVGVHRLDLLVEDEVVVELKAVRHLEDVHFVILRSYLAAVGRRHGLLLNFSRPTLQIKRVEVARFLREAS